MGFQEELEKARQAKEQRELQQRLEREQNERERNQMIIDQELYRNARVEKFRSSSEYKKTLALVNNSRLTEAFQAYSVQSNSIFEILDYFDQDSRFWKLNEENLPRNQRIYVNLGGDRIVWFFFNGKISVEYTYMGWTGGDYSYPEVQSVSYEISDLDELILFFVDAIVEGFEVAVGLYQKKQSENVEVVEVIENEPKRKKFLGIF